MNWVIFVKFLLCFIGLMLFVFALLGLFFISIRWTFVNNDISLPRLGVVAMVMLLALGVALAYGEAKS